MAVVYHWKHGWIPLDHAAALSKAKGDHDLAAKMLASAHSPAVGINSRESVAKAALDLPNLPASHRLEALSHLHAAAQKHNSGDLMPGHNGGVTRNQNDSEHQRLMSLEDSRSAVKRPADHNLSSLSDQQLDAAIQRAKDSGSERLLSQLQAEKARRRIHPVK